MQQPQVPESAPNSAGCLLRLFWMLISHAVVYTSLAMIALNGLAFPSPLDAVVWVTVVLSIFARRIDITRCDGTTVRGEPATLAHWRRHAALVVMVTAVASVLAHAFGA